MKKLIATLLVLTMVLALTGTVAMADCKFKAGDYVKFNKNTHLYDGHHDSDRTGTIVRKGSIACVIGTSGSKWVQLRLEPIIVNGDVSGYILPTDYQVKEYHVWVKADDLKKISLEKALTSLVWKGQDGTKYVIGYADTHVVFSENGNGNKNSRELAAFKENTTPDLKHVKATAKVWLRKSYSLHKSYGKALHKDDKVCYRHCFGVDTRLVAYYGVRYEGKNLWVSSEYSKLVK